MSSYDDDVSCLSWGCVLKRDHLGIKCSQGHDICPDCSKLYVSNMLSEPELNIPAKCSMCGLKINSVLVEMHMDPAQLEMYLLCNAMKEIDENEKVMNCSFWKYFEVWLKTNTSNFFYCK